MKFFLILCALAFCLAEGTRFRFDYTYHQEAEGWLKLHRIPATWKDAYLTCYYEGAVLASPENRKMRGAIKDTITDQQLGLSLSPRGVFTGIHATFGKGAYFSVEGTPLSRLPVVWAPGEPDNADNNEDCLLMLPSGSLADVNCSDVYPYVCYRKKQPNMKLNVCGTVDNGYTYENRTGSCYKFHSDPLNWTRAFVACAHEGGHLAVVNSKLEHQLIVELFNNGYPSLIESGSYNRKLIFLGFKSFEGHFLWKTIHGQTLKEAGFDEWSKGQPDFNHQRCGAMFKDGLLDDSACSDVYAFICEKQPCSLLADEEL